MGRIALFVLVLVLAIPFVAAGDSYDIDFSQASTIPVSLQNGDEVRFTLLDQKNVLLLEDIGKQSVKVGLVLGNDTKVVPGLVLLDYIMKVDTNKDGTPDLNVALYGVSNGTAQLVFQDVSHETNSSVDTGVVGTDSSSSSKKNVFLGVVGVLILALVAFLVFRGKKKKEHHAVHHHAEKKDEEVKVESASPAESDSEKSSSETDLE
ncbi:LPXTG cell wall anchor domain-containing protein [Candidatus Woesearchaeota archaeon]|nr:LPXTG cell wall anchor domain-containing protein [Candidatus Woesearchaeota archaeon]